MLPPIRAFPTPKMTRLRDFTDAASGYKKTPHFSDYKAQCGAQLMNFSAHGVHIDLAGRTFTIDKMSHPAFVGDV